MKHNNKLVLSIFFTLMILPLPLQAQSAAQREYEKERTLPKITGPISEQERKALALSRSLKGKVPVANVKNSNLNASK